MNRLLFAGLFALACQAETINLPGVAVIQDNPPRLEAPGKVANTNGILEFVAVEKEGREYESLLALNCRPQIFQAALLALCGETGLTRQVTIEVAWVAGGKAQRVPVDRWLLDRKTKQPPAGLKWVFNGSRFVKHPVTGNIVFQADEERAHVALWWQPSIPVNIAGDFGNPYKGDTHGFEVHTAVVPPVGTPVTVIIRAAGAQ
jgi:hypothetical protein